MKTFLNEFLSGNEECFYLKRGNESSFMMATLQKKLLDK